MQKRRVLIGVTGCIAAYKSCEIVRSLQKRGVEVSVIMTENASRFVGVDTFSALTGSRVAIDNFGCMEDPIPHIRYGEESDLYLIAPCTANMLSKVALGIADDLVSTTALVAHERLMVAPAMNVNMYRSLPVQENLKSLSSHGVRIISPGSGYLACGDEGEGRLADIEDIVDAVFEELEGTPTGYKPQDMSGQKVLVTAGPTHEPIDPVRYISNPSSGKMGYAIAEAARDRGAEVCLVSGPVSITAPSGIKLIQVRTAEEMMRACEEEFPNADTAIFCAAVSDMRPRNASDHKLKKGIDDAALQTIELVENPDILKTLASSRRPDQYVIGFAAETDDVIENAKRKLDSKGADLIVGNEVGTDLGFGKDASNAYLVDSLGVTELPNMQKLDIANRILDKACEFRGVC